MNKVAKVILIFLSFLVLAAIGSVVVVFNLIQADSDGGTLSIDEMNEFSYSTPEMTTDLEDGHFVRIQFMIITDSKKALKEVEKREFQIDNVLIKELSVMAEEDFTSGLTELEETLQKSLNEVMEDGKVTDVYTINKILQ